MRCKTIRYSHDCCRSSGDFTTKSSSRPLSLVFYHCLSMPRLVALSVCLSVCLSVFLSACFACPLFSPNSISSQLTCLAAKCMSKCCSICLCLQGCPSLLLNNLLDSSHGIIRLSLVLESIHCFGCVHQFSASVIALFFPKSFLSLPLPVSLSMPPSYLSLFLRIFVCLSLSLSISLSLALPPFLILSLLLPLSAAF